MNGDLPGYRRPQPGSDLDPALSLLAWFDTLSVGKQQALAFFYVFLTSRNSNDFVLSEEQCLRRFRLLVEAPDFPIRKVMSLIQIRGLIDFVFRNAEYAWDQANAEMPLALHVSLPSLTEKNWRSEIERWRDFAEQHLSDPVLHRWLLRAGG